MVSLPEQVRAHDEDAAWMRRIQSDMRPFVEAFADRLEGAMPRRVKVGRRRTGMFGPRRVHSITVEAGGRSYSATMEGDTLSCRRALVARGIALQSEDMKLRPWMDALMSDISSMAEDADTAHRSLHEFLMS